MSDTDLEIDELDDDRELCPDGACIGVIGPDGRCKECGKKGSGAPKAAKPAAARTGAAANDEEVLYEDDDPRAGQVASAGGGAASEDDESFDDDRRLCPDGACIGVLGSDGVCKECGARG